MNVAVFSTKHFDKAFLEKSKAVFLSHIPMLEQTVRLELIDGTNYLIG